MADDKLRGPADVARREVFNLSFGICHLSSERASGESGKPVVGIEPTTRALRMRCSTTELHRRRRNQSYRAPDGRRQARRAPNVWRGAALVDGSSIGWQLAAPLQALGARPGFVSRLGSRACILVIDISGV